MKIYYKTINNVNLLMDYDVEGSSEMDILNLEEETFVDYNNKKLIYHFLIESNSYDKLLSNIQNEKITVKGLRFNYKVKNQYKYRFIPFFPLFLIILTLINIFTSSTSEITNLNLSGIIIFLSFLTFYYSLIREGYEIPWNRSLLIFIPLAGFTILFPKFISSLIL